MIDSQHFFHQYLQLSRSFTKNLNEHLAAHGMFHSQWVIIHFLKRNGPATLSEIVQYLNVEKPTVTRTVSRLEERNLIVQLESTDKRLKRIDLTKAGEEMYELCNEAALNYEKTVIAGVTEEEMTIAMNVIKKMQKQLQQEDVDQT
ncbi:MarR family winged helix-turn-helix transcriptional regulator [Pradoshia sp.]